MFVTAACADPVGELVREVWAQREDRTLPCDAAQLARRMAVAAAGTVQISDGYDPETDTRMVWLRGICAAMRRNPRRMPRAEGADEAVVMWLLDKVPINAARRGMQD